MDQCPNIDVHQVLIEVLFYFQSIDMCKNEEIEYQLAAKQECFV